LFDLNDKTGPKNTYPYHISLSDKGAPICIGGHEMVYNGFCPDRSRIKWRCPLVCGKIPDCFYNTPSPDPSEIAPPLRARINPKTAAATAAR